MVSMCTQKPEARLEDALKDFFSVAQVPDKIPKFSNFYDTKNDSDLVVKVLREKGITLSESKDYWSPVPNQRILSPYDWRKLHLEQPPIGMTGTSDIS